MDASGDGITGERKSVITATGIMANIVARRSAIGGTDMSDVIIGVMAIASAG